MKVTATSNLFDKVFSVMASVEAEIDLIFLVN